MPKNSVVFSEERCKGCELCVTACPKQIIRMGEHINTKGFHPATIVDPEKCIGCAFCARMCPDMVIEIHRE
ncbi:MAG: 4Fe-4S binding protein [Bacillota bacterium]